MLEHTAPMFQCTANPICIFQRHPYQDINIHVCRRVVLVCCLVIRSVGRCGAGNACSPRYLIHHRPLSCLEQSVARVVGSRRWRSAVFLGLPVQAIVLLIALLAAQRSPESLDPQVWVINKITECHGFAIAVDHRFFLLLLGRSIWNPIARCWPSSGKGTPCSFERPSLLCWVISRAISDRSLCR